MDAIRFPIRLAGPAIPIIQQPRQFQPEPAIAQKAAKDERSLKMQQANSIMVLGGNLFAFMKSMCSGSQRLHAIHFRSLYGKMDAVRFRLPERNALSDFIQKAKEFEAELWAKYTKGGKKTPIGEWTFADRTDLMHAQRAITRAKTLIKIHELLDVLKHQSNEEYARAFRAAMDEKTDSGKRCAVAKELGMYRIYFEEYIRPALEKA